MAKDLRKRNTAAKGSKLHKRDRQEDTTKSINRSSILNRPVKLFAFVALSIVVGGYFLLKLSVEESPHTKINSATLKVGIPTWADVQYFLEPVQWSDIESKATARGLSVADYLSMGRKPVILLNTPADSWKAMSLWNVNEPIGVSYITSHVPQLNKVRRANTSTFVYEDYSRMMGKLWETSGAENGPYSSAVNPPSQERVNMTTLEYLGSQNPNANQNGFSYYYSHVLNDTNSFAVLDSDASPRGFLRVNEVPVDQNSNSVYWDCEATIGPVENCASIWMGQPGIIAGLHYDPTHNFFVQVAGGKRFVLADPQHHDAIHLYPFYHPRDRQSQLEQVHGNENELGPESKIPVYIADLEPGAVLYLPPYVFHRVAVLDHRTSLSLNLWTSSNEKVLSDTLFDHIPESVHRTGKHDVTYRATVLALFLRKVLGFLGQIRFGYTHGLDFSDLNFFQTHSEILPDVQHEWISFLNQFLGERYLYEKNPGMAKALKCHNFIAESCPKDGKLQDDLQQEVDVAVKTVVSKLRKFLWKAKLAGRTSLDAFGITEMILADFMERVVAFGFRDLGAMCKFFQCLKAPGSWM